jgi:hypothetical protein
MSQGDLDASCEYKCINGVYTLTGGSAPPGYVCRKSLGVCNNPGDVLFAPPMPIDDIPPGAASSNDED